jgi:hypothetical protein
MRREDAQHRRSGRDSLRSRLHREGTRDSIEQLAKAGCDRFRPSLVLTRAGTALAAQATLVLEHVMSKLVRKDVPEHEAFQRIRRPADEAEVAEVRARSFKLGSLFLGQPRGEAPWRGRLVVEDDPAWSGKLTEDQPVPTRRRGRQLNDLQAVVDLLAEDLQGVANIRS